MHLKQEDLGGLVESYYAIVNDDFVPGVYFTKILQDIKK